MPETFPEDWRDQPCFIVTVPRPLVPYVGGLLKILEKRGFWSEDIDYERGYTATLELERCLMSTCVNDLLERQDALYRLLDTALFGTEYTIESTDPLVVTPPIPAARLLAYDNQASLLGRADQSIQLVDNTLNGTETPLYAYTPSVKELLQGVIDAIAAEDTDLEAMLAQLELIATLVA